MPSSVEVQKISESEGHITSAYKVLEGIGREGLKLITTGPFYVMDY